MNNFCQVIFIILIHTLPKISETGSVKNLTAETLFSQTFRRCSLHVVTFSPKLWKSHPSNGYNTQIPTILDHISPGNLDSHRITLAFKLFLHNRTEFYRGKNFYSVKIPCYVVHLDLSNVLAEEEKPFYLDSVIYLLTRSTIKDPDYFIFQDVANPSKKITQNWVQFISIFHKGLLTSKILFYDSPTSEISLYCYTCVRRKKSMAHFLIPVRVSNPGNSERISLDKVDQVLHTLFLFRCFNKEGINI